jgi:hypothetical protein
MRPTVIDVTVMLVALAAGAGLRVVTGSLLR